MKPMGCVVLSVTPYRGKFKVGYENKRWNVISPIMLVVKCAHGFEFYPIMRRVVSKEKSSVQFLAY